MNETILIVDGDGVAFRAACVVEQRSISVTHNPTGKVKTFKTRTEFKEVITKKFGSLDNLKDYSIEDVQTPEPVANALQAAKSIMTKIFTAIEPDDMIVYIGGKDNFREKLPLPSKYKGNRGDMLRPLLLDEVKSYIMKKYKAKSPVGIEADDAINIRAYEELAKGNSAIIASSDKDTLQSEGVYMFDYTKEKPSLFLIPEVGEVHMHKNTIKGSGLKFFAYQLLCGDTTDNYKPTEICKARFGATGAFKLLNPLQTQPDILEAVVKKYKEWYPDIVTYTSWDGKEITTNWEGMLDIYYSCAYMHRKKNDTTTWKDFFKERGWNE